MISDSFSGGKLKIPFASCQFVVKLTMNVNNVSVFFDQVREILVGGLADNVFPIVFGFGYKLDDR